MRLMETIKRDTPGGTNVLTLRIVDASPLSWTLPLPFRDPAPLAPRSLGPRREGCTLPRQRRTPSRTCSKHTADCASPKSAFEPTQHQCDDAGQSTSRTRHLWFRSLVGGLFAAVWTKRTWSAKQIGEDRPWGGELRHLADFAVWKSVVGESGESIGD